jgi:hypothetical protein
MQIKAAVRKVKATHQEKHNKQSTKNSARYARKSQPASTEHGNKNSQTATKIPQKKSYAVLFNVPYSENTCHTLTG